MPLTPHSHYSCLHSYFVLLLNGELSREAIKEDVCYRTAHRFCYILGVGGAMRYCALLSLISHCPIASAPFMNAVSVLLQCLCDTAAQTDFGFWSHQPYSFDSEEHLTHPVGNKYLRFSPSLSRPRPLTFTMDRPFAGSANTFSDVSLRTSNIV